MDINSTLAAIPTQVPHKHLAEQAQNAKASGNGSTKPVDKESPLYKAAQDFEAIFVKQMLDSMRKTVNKSGLNDGGHAEEIFEDMLYNEYAGAMTKTAGFGLSDQLYRQLSWIKEVPKSTDLLAN